MNADVAGGSPNVATYTRRGQSANSETSTPSARKDPVYRNTAARTPTSSSNGRIAGH